MSDIHSERKDMILVRPGRAEARAAERTLIRVAADPREGILYSTGGDPARYEAYCAARRLEYSYLPDEVEFDYQVEFSTVPIEGNVLATGNEAVDRQAELAVISASNSGDVWAWADVKVSAVLRDEDGEIDNQVYLHGSWENEDDFLQHDYGHMCGEALSDLRQHLSEMLLEQEHRYANTTSASAACVIEVH